ncbi:hypothetical protein RJ639_000494 [Escallonia herrerae]|uniref:Auxin efflux carrier component n=1 Tax=Escallonia herrerae TaxID=1293975 RepID=A0AA88XJX6_9ASTE|nr:hypothetical protein RJ639_000494 [Escallonia herrerae]
MINSDDFYKVMCAMVPLYFAMLVAYGSVKWWKIFTPEQCSGINRFVAVFAVPVLSFHFISQNNPYQMDTKFILADTLSKVLVLVLLSFWAILRGGLGWLITLFSVSTLPNTLVMGIPLLKAMYGDFTQSLMVQLVVLQCIIWYYIYTGFVIDAFVSVGELLSSSSHGYIACWVFFFLTRKLFLLVTCRYTLLLFLFEYRAATILIRHQFPGPAAASISSFHVDCDVASLHGGDPLRTESETDARGRTRVRIRRSTDSTMTVTPRASNLSGAEIFSVNTPATGDFGFSGYASSDVYSLQPTPRASNFNEFELGSATAGNTPSWVRSPAAGRVFRQQSPAVGGMRIVWGSPGEYRGEEGQEGRDVGGDKELSFRDCSKLQVQGEADTKGTATTQEMPHALVMLRLILTMVGRKLSRNPNTYSSVIGLLWSLISFKWNVEMPSLAKYSVKIISDAGLGMAMFSLGLFMALQPRIIACGPKMATVGMLIRFVGGPVLMSAASVAVGLRGAQLHTAIVQAALPQGIVPFVFAREYGLHPDILSTGVIFGMLVSLPVTLLYYIVLGL